MRARPCNVGGPKHTKNGVRSGNLEEARSEPEWEGDVVGATELQNPKTQVHWPRGAGMMLDHQVVRVESKPENKAWNAEEQAFTTAMKLKRTGKGPKAER